MNGIGSCDIVGELHDIKKLQRNIKEGDKQEEQRKIIELQKRSQFIE
jgi:hypothetical protein